MSMQRRLARFNRRFANYIFGHLSRMPGFGALYHRGRKSGREYRTPVKIFRRDGNYVIALPYGPESDWVKNVLAAGGCELVTRGRRVRLAEPLIFEDHAQAHIPAHIRAVLLRLNVTLFIMMTPVEVAAARV